MTGNTPPPIAAAEPRLVRLEAVDSTNREAERRILAGTIAPVPALLIAREQSGGEGRRGSAWHSPPGGLWATLAWHISTDQESLSALGLRLGAACLDAVAAFGGADARLKWPNDVLIGDAKVSGCMVRTRAHDGRLWGIAGIGINVNNPMRDVAGLDRPATSLVEATGRAVPLDDVIDALRTSLRSHVLGAVGLPPGLLERLNRRLWGLGRPLRLRVGQGEISGVLLGLSAAGLPRVRTPMGAEVVVPQSARPVG